MIICYFCPCFFPFYIYSVSKRRSNRVRFCRLRFGWEILDKTNGEDAVANIREFSAAEGTAQATENINAAAAISAAAATISAFRFSPGSIISRQLIFSL